jgi:hypothetical protein
MRMYALAIGAPWAVAERKVSERSGEDRSCRFRTRWCRRGSGWNLKVA